MTTVASITHRDQLSTLRLADWLAVVVAIVLPWSITATEICNIAWLLAVLPTVNGALLRREVGSAVGGLPVLLWCLGVIGTLWGTSAGASAFSVSAVSTVCSSFRCYLRNSDVRSMANT
jgi:hypothetical protein